MAEKVIEAIGPEKIELEQNDERPALYQREEEEIKESAKQNKNSNQPTKSFTPQCRLDDNNEPFDDN